MAKQMMLCLVLCTVALLTGCGIQVQLDPSQPNQPACQARCATAALWVRQANSATSIKVKSVALDHEGHAYITGSFYGLADFGQIQLESPKGRYNAFVAKLDSDGKWLWAKKVGTIDNSSEGASVALDRAGSVYITGIFRGPGSFGSIVLTPSNGLSSLFVAKLDTQGNWLWAKRAGGAETSTAQSIALDASGNVYITGAIRAVTTFGSIEIGAKGAKLAFVAKLDEQGKWLWAKEAGTHHWEFWASGTSIAVDASGNVVFAGKFYKKAEIGTTSLVAKGGWDVFIARLDSKGQWLWAKSTGAKFDDEARGVAINSRGDIFLTGALRLTDDREVIGHNRAFGDEDIFITKYEREGKLLWTKKVRSRYAWLDGDMDRGVAVDASDNVFITGPYEKSAAFGKSELTSKGSRDAFLAKLDNQGEWLWAKSIGAKDDDVGLGVATDRAGHHFVVGTFRGEVTFGSTPLDSKGKGALFVWKSK